MYEKIFVGRHVCEISKPPEFEPISKVVVLLDGENAYLAGDESGRTVEVTCPYATQQMADDLLSKLRGYKYRPVTAVDALINPAAEPGDSITIDGVYTILANMDTDYDSLMSSGVSAPGQGEIESEYQFQDKEKQLELKIARTRSLVTKTAEQIRLEVANELEGLEASLTIKVDSISAEVIGAQNAISLLELDLDGITQRVQDAEGNLAELELTASGLEARVEDTEGAYAELAFTVDGLTITDATGQTKINGSAVYTPNLYVNAANIEGSLVAGDLQGDYIFILDSDGNYAASMTVNAAQTADYKLDINAAAIAITTEESGGALFLGNADGSYLQIIGTRVYCNAYFRPGDDNAYDIGSSSYRWGDIYATNDVIQTSDKKKKKSISYSLDKFDVFFDGLMPGTYQLIDGKRDHIGLVAQDIESNLEKCGISTTEFAGFVKAEREDGEGYDYGLRYGEFVALLIDQVQKLKARVNILEDKHGSKKTA